jgi:CO/xanthine dehydrogenase FAD-binding subunit
MRAPEDLSAVLELMASERGVWRPFAGGTDLMVLLEAGKLSHKRFLSLWKLQELRGIQTSAEHLSIGSLTTYTDLQRNDLIAREFPLLRRAASETGSVATQNRGTLGGNIANASPAADSPPALLVYDAEIEMISTRGLRRVRYDGFSSEYKQIDLREDELIHRIRLPRRNVSWTQHYRKVGTRRAQAISKVCFAAGAQMKGRAIADVRLAFGSIAPTVVRPVETEALLRHQILSPALIRAASEKLLTEIVPIDDLRSTARYRSRVAQNLLMEFLESLSL